MHIGDLPASMLIGTTAEVRLLERLLEVAMDDRTVTFAGFDVVEGATQSCRVLVRRPIPELVRVVPFHRPLSCLDMALELLHDDFLKDVRLQPIKPPDQHAKKGWEIGVVTMWNARVVVACAKWVY